MANLNLMNPGLRKSILEEMEAYENSQRKLVSLQQYEVYKDRIRKFVKLYLEGFYSKETIEELPIFSSVNIARRIVNKEASIYLNEPEREFYGVSEKQKEILNQIYEDMNINNIMLRANRFYKLQDEQIHLYVVPSEGKLKAKVMLGHQIDAVPSLDDVEKADCYLIQGFDRMSQGLRITETEDGTNQLIADQDDYQSSLTSIAVWSKIFNFIMDDKGNITSLETNNELGMIPIIDINSGKDSEYWIRSGSSLTDFTIQFNAAISDLQHIVRMQGFGQAWLKGDTNIIPENIKIGPNFILKLPINPNNPVDTDFGYSNANADISGSIQQVELLLSTFLTSRGLDPKLVNGKSEAQSFSSGFERMLSMIDSFEPSKTDFAVFKDAECKLFEIVRAYVNLYGGTNVLPNYTAGVISQDAYVSINYEGPEIVSSDKEKLDNIKLRLDMGLISQTEAIAIDRDLDEEEAVLIMEKINLDKQKNNPQHNTVVTTQETPMPEDDLSVEND